MDSIEVLIPENRRLLFLETTTNPEYIGDKPVYIYRPFLIQAIQKRILDHIRHSNDKCKIIVKGLLIRDKDKCLKYREPQAVSPEEVRAIVTPFIIKGYYAYQNEEKGAIYISRTPDNELKPLELTPYASAYTSRYDEESGKYILTDPEPPGIEAAIRRIGIDVIVNPILWLVEDTKRKDIHVIEVKTVGEYERNNLTVTITLRDKRDEEDTKFLIKVVPQIQGGYMYEMTMFGKTTENMKATLKRLRPNRDCKTMLECAAIIRLIIEQYSRV